MSWARGAQEALRKGETVVIRPRGHSMKGLVNDGSYVTVAPCATSELTAGDVVLVRVQGKDYLHLIKAIDQERFLIGNNKGGTNGWVGKAGIYGKAIAISAVKHLKIGQDSLTE